MNWMEFLADVIGSLAWPVVVAVLALVVWRAAPPGDRASLLRRFRKVPGIELDSAEADIQAATSPEATSISRPQEAEVDDGLPFDADTRFHMDQLIEAAAR